MRVIDLFAGAGGFSTGFEKQGFQIYAAIEIEEDMAQTIKFNHPNTIIYNTDIKDFDASNIKAEVVIGGPPCQGFSLAGARVRKEFIDDPRNFLFKEYIRILKQVKPKYFVMENVPGIKSMEGGEIFSNIINELSKLQVNEKKYTISYDIIDASDYGVPQERKRMIILGSLSGLTINQLKNKRNPQKKSVWDVISNLENVPTNKIVKLNGKLVSGHFQSNHNLDTLKKIIGVRNNIEVKTGSKFSGAYKVMKKNSPAKTITTRFDAPSAGAYIHPTLNRTITPREAARIQTFPDDYHFIGSHTNIRKMIGNAVPVSLAESIAKLIKEDDEIKRKNCKK